MALVTRWDPFAELQDFQRNMSRVLSRLATPGVLSDESPLAWSPTCDVFSRGDDLVIRAEIPGVKPEDVEVTVTNNVLHLRGERHDQSQTTTEEYMVKESAFGTFERTIPLPEGCKLDEITAEYETGVIEIVVPKTPVLESEHKTIPVHNKDKKRLTAA